MNGDSVVKTDDLIKTSSHCQGENVKENIKTSDILEPANDKQANGLDTEKSSDDKLSDEKITDEKLLDEELADEKISDQKLPEEKLHDNIISAEKLADEKIPINPRLPDKKTSDETISDEELTDEKICDKKLSVEELTNKKISDEELPHEKISDEKLPDDIISDGKLTDDGLSDENISDVELSDGEMSDEKLFDDKSSDEKVPAKDVTINPEDLSKTPNKIKPVDGADISAKNALDDSVDNLDKVASDGNEGCNLNCEEKVAESDSDPLAPQSSDPERVFKPVTNKGTSDTPLNNDEAVSVNSESDDDELLCLGEASPNSDIILIDGEQNGDSEVHEILSDDDNDDCIVTSEKAEVTSLASRRTRRIPKKNRYYASEDEQESDLEVIPIDDPLNDRVKLQNKRKSAAARLKQKKTKKSANILVVDAMDIVKKKDKSIKPVKNRIVDNKKLHENIAACGTTITPVTAKDSSNAITIVQQPVPEPEPILPSLTDDMFVVEAPSFIVPYVYEKPADVHFKTFVTKLGNELEEQKAKEEELRIQKEKEDKEKREKEIQERKERGEDYSDLLDDNEKEKEAKEEEKQKKKQLREERRRKRRAGEEDDPAWEADNAETSSSEDLSEDDMKARDDDIAVLPTAAAAPKQVDAYFTTTLGRFFMDIGMNLVQENVQHDLLKQENRKLNREKRGGYNTKATQSSIAALTNNIEKSKEKNASFTFTFEKCKLCSFKSESAIVMANHMEVPHMKNNMFVCNFCMREIKGCHDILVHMLLEHQVKGRLERSQVSQQCATCPYEDNNKARLGRHIISCMKKFKPESNLAVTEWEPPAKIPKLVKPPPHSANAFLNSRGMYAGVNVNRAAHGSGTNSLFPQGPKPVPLRPLPRPNILSKQVKDPFAKQIIAPPPKALVPPNIMQRNRPGIEGKKAPANLAISPLPGGRAQNAAMDSTFVMCEICDGYIKDLDQLRNHMLWIHKIKIHPKMIHNRPPLNCQKCQFRFFTDQGLERHLLGAHGLVTNSMQEAANSKKDCGRCPICGKVYQYKLLGHVARDHSMTLKPAHLSYKCTVCTATFDTYKEFECHVYSAHRVVTKRLAEKAKAAEPAK